MNFKKILAVGLFIFILFYAFRFFYSKSHEFIIDYPFNNALFPPEFPAPSFEWRTDNKYNGNWAVELTTSDKKYSIKKIISTSKWSPDEAAWDSLKLFSNYENIKFNVYKEGGKWLSKSIRFKISHDTVGSPVLYRQMPIPFVVAEKFLDSMNFMLINFGSKKSPHIAMKGFPVCGNCHSFSADGKTIGLDLDAGRRDKGGYFVSNISDSILFNRENYMSWTKIENRRTFGLFSKLSPDGRYIITTVKDRIVSKNFESPDKADFSQLFFPINGHLAVYDRNTHVLKELPGANLDEYVQSNAIWTPDGKYIIFARAKSLPYEFDTLEINLRNDMLIDQYVDRKLQFKFDLCIIPFNEGNGGEAKLIEGASNNGMSNYFPAVSPNGKWLVYCQAENFMLLQPNSKLFIVPLHGGKGKKLECNLSSMNSWHAWSINSKWIVFSSKGLSPYTDMFLTHIDDNGNASAPVLVEKARVNRRVINYPEFINKDPNITFDMDYDFVELSHIERAIIDNDYKTAKTLADRFIQQDPMLFQEDYYTLSNFFKQMGYPDEAKKYYELAAKNFKNK